MPSNLRDDGERRKSISNKKRRDLPYENEGISQAEA